MMSETEDSNGNWTTWEELLLAFAVNRHGTKSWESIAIEIQNRSSSSLLTAHNCKKKYYELQRRFTAVDEKIDGVDVGSEIGDTKKIPWLDELRKLRVAELRREVQRYDVSIVSLQSKVKKLKEERERSLTETDNDDEKPDLEKKEGESARDDEKGNCGEEKKPKRISGDESDRENQSFNESNSTDSKDRNPEIGTDEGKRKTERSPKPKDPAETGSGKPDPAVPGELPEDKAIGEGSYNGSSDTIAKGAMVSSSVKSLAPIPVPDIGESAEFHESVAESKGGEEGMKENSDVQSSASLSKKIRRRKAITGSSSGEEPEPDEVSPVSRRISIKSHPLVGFLEIIRSHKHGSVFERRLESQESTDYQRLIRQHLDLEMVRTKVEEGLYSDRSLEFFRDLLLLFNNAIVFFSKNASESVAAIKLRELVSKEMSRLIPKPYQPSSSSKSLPKPDPEPANSLPAKTNSSPPLIACGKRSSNSSKAQPVLEMIVKEKPENNEKPDVAEPERPNVEPRITKKRTRERSASVARGSRTNNTRGNGTRASNPPPPPPPPPHPSSNSSKATGSNENVEAKTEKKSGNAAVVAKKRSAANFLNRMKRSLSSSSSAQNSTLLDSLKNSSISNSRGPEQKKGGRRDSGLRKQVEDQSGTVAKRSVGRPPKRVAPPQSSSRRAKETVETESKRRPRKRARR